MSAKEKLKKFKIKKTLQAKNKTLVEKSKFFKEYDRWVKSGWSMEQCSRFAKTLFGEDISPEQFYKYREKIPPTQILDVNILPGRMKDIDIALDNLTIVNNLILEQFERLKQVRELEKKTKVPTKSADRIIETLVKLIQTKHIIEKDLGLAGDGPPELPLKVEDEYIDDDTLAKRLKSLAEKVNSESDS